MATFQNITMANQNHPLYGDPANWSNFSTLNSTISFNGTEAKLLVIPADPDSATTIDFNGNQLAYITDIPSLNDWSLYPAASDVEISSYNMSNVLTLTADTGIFSTVTTNTFNSVVTIDSSTIRTSTLTALEILTSSIAFPDGDGTINCNSLLNIIAGSNLHLEAYQADLLTSVGNVTIQSAQDIILGSGQSTIVSTNTFTVLNSTFFKGPVDFNNIAPTNLPGITDGAVAASTVTASTMFTANLSASVVLLSTLKFAPSLGGVNVDMGLGTFFGDTAAWAGASFGLAAGVGTIILADRFATGTVGPTIARLTNYLNPASNTVELVNVTTQLQISTVGSIQSSILRLASSLTVGGPLSEVFVSSYISSGATCLRSLSDPLNTVSTGASSFIQAFGKWTGIPYPASNPSVWSNYPTLNSSITFNVNSKELVSQVSSTNNFLTYDNKQLAITTNNNVYSYDFWVSPNGSDSIGTGAILSPWLTITYALTQIAGITSTNPVTIHLMSGIYNESPTITRNCTYISGSLNDPFATPLINVTGTITFTITSIIGSNIVNCGLMNLSMYGFIYNGNNPNAGANSCTLRNCCINNTGTAVVCYQQFNTSAVQHSVYLNNCYVLNTLTGQNTCTVTTGALSVVNTTLATITANNIIGLTGSAITLTIRNSVLQNSSASTGNAALIRVVAAGASILDISYSRLIYTSAAVDVAVSNKCCIQLASSAGSIALNNFISNYLYCEGARVINPGPPTQYLCIQKSGASSATMFYGYTACGPTANHIAVGITATTAVAMGP